ncbi:hypothetical protein V8G54_021641 [Vigna mungo]|uniref:Uncharacterized protein n=1 Tax=Vigna mungo TaxID=3915 RepID=A0AAQ3NDN5_VIGMU
MVYFNILRIVQLLHMRNICVLVGIHIMRSQVNLRMMTLRQDRYISSMHPCVFLELNTHRLMSCVPVSINIMRSQINLRLMTLRQNRYLRRLHFCIFLVLDCHRFITPHHSMNFGICSRIGLLIICLFYERTIHTIITNLDSSQINCLISQNSKISSQIWNV